MKKFIENYGTLIGQIALLCTIYIILVAAIKRCDSYSNNANIATANMKAYDKLLSAANEKNVAYQLTIDQLNYANDSILQELNEARKELKIKDKNVKSVQYISSTFEKTDTITLTDTLFKENIAIDTVVGDEWYKADISLRYPDTMIVSPSFKSEKNIIVSTKKETVNPPKKWWLLKLFQRKHTVLNVDVIEKNPYAVDSESRYVEIIK